MLNQHENEFERDRMCRAMCGHTARQAVPFGLFCLCSFQELNPVIGYSLLICPPVLEYSVHFFPHVGTVAQRGDLPWTTEQFGDRAGIRHQGFKGP